MDRMQIRRHYKNLWKTQRPQPTNNTEIQNSLESVWNENILPVSVLDTSLLPLALYSF
jgi:hypothetical protein